MYPLSHKIASLLAKLSIEQSNVRQVLEMVNVRKTEGCYDEATESIYSAMICSNRKSTQNILGNRGEVYLWSIGKKLQMRLECLKKKDAHIVSHHCLFILLVSCLDTLTVPMVSHDAIRLVYLLQARKWPSILWYSPTRWENTNKGSAFTRSMQIRKPRIAIT